MFLPKISHLSSCCVAGTASGRPSAPAGKSRHSRPSTTSSSGMRIARACASALPFLSSSLVHPVVSRVCLLRLSLQGGICLECVVTFYISVSGFMDFFSGASSWCIISYDLHVSYPVCKILERVRILCLHSFRACVCSTIIRWFVCFFCACRSHAHPLTVSEELLHLLYTMLCPDPSLRCPLSDLLQHQWFSL